jgi:hypothetical protein
MRPWSCCIIEFNFEATIRSHWNWQIITGLASIYIWAVIYENNKFKRYLYLMKIGEKYFMRERVISKQLLMQFLCSKDQIVDIMNKALTAPRFGCLKNKLTFAPAPSTCGGELSSNKWSYPIVHNLRKLFLRFMWLTFYIPLSLSDCSLKDWNDHTFYIPFNFIFSANCI